MGAAWYRTYTALSPGIGFVSEDVPELSIAVIASRRREGIGRQLLVELINASVDQGHAALSLSVREQNPARHLYESVGFVTVARDGIVLDHGPTRHSDTLTHNPTGHHC